MPHPETSTAFFGPSKSTHSIDTATETLIQEAMARGRIIEDGSHTALMGRDGHYARLHGHQMMGVMVGGGLSG
ncbi:MAG: hypothetical protein KBG20_11415 [Caldilineaceae bacterium]|nr:hypothetical protein [Caldilineaceae bacterium]MBP8122783.1 hypothetical protein [Caldilineaceae bacterium]MBP9072905.1 hypothetical protein [Caldilineaceae bacterium]